MLSADCLGLGDGDTQDGPGSASSKFLQAAVSTSGSTRM